MENLMKKIYIETSVISYFVSEQSENIRIAGHQFSTKKMWKELYKFEVFVSDTVVEEASKGNPEQVMLRFETLKEFQVLEINDKAKELAKGLLAKKAIPKKCPEDALHIAVAAVNEIDFIITWNFKHINNPFMKNHIRNVIEEMGYTCPEICSPEELLGE
jgi:5,10-methenyltetrahydromethanopterin hydrogenase